MNYESEYSNILEVSETNSIEQVNELLQTRKWVLLKIYAGTQHCYNKIVIAEQNNELKIQPFDKIIKIFILGRIADD